MASKDTPEGLGGETLPVWVQQPQRARPVWAGVRQTPFHVPLTGQRGRTMKEGELASCCLTEEGCGGRDMGTTSILISV